MICYILLLLFIFLSSGCGRIDYNNDICRLSEKVHNQTGLNLEPNNFSTSYLINNCVKVEPEILELIKKPISREDAVQIALLNNKTLQAKLDELGIAKSDLVQAGLLQNPGLAGIFSLPIGDVKEARIDEVVALFPISDLWQVPLKVNVAQNDLEIASLSVLGAILDTISQARVSYDNLLYKSELFELTQKLILEAEQVYKKFSRRKISNLVSDFDNYFYEIEIERYKLIKDSLEDDIHIAKTDLAKNLGLPLACAMGIKLEDNFNNLKIEIPKFGTLLQWAYKNKPEFQISLFKIEKHKQHIRLEKAKLFSEVSFGIGYQTQAIGQTQTQSEPFVGPAFDMKIPLFDQNQAQIAKAELYLSQAVKELEASKLNLEYEVYKEYYSVKGYKEQEKTYKDILEPLIRKKIELNKRLAKRENKFTPNVILQTHKSLYDVQTKIIESRFDTLNSISNLERAIGRRINLGCH